MNPQQLGQLTATVQRNCHIVDARYGASYGLCIYLIKMREFYRWERGHAFSDSLPKDDVGEWLSERESLWESLEEEEFATLQIDGEHFDPFDAEAINRRLNPVGLAYSGGLGHAARPHFFLGELERQERNGGTPLLVVGRELARDLAAPPAMTGQGTIFLRRESLRRMLWEKLENWRWARADNPMGRAFACYDFDRDLEGSLDAMTSVEIDAIIDHERGEAMVGKIVGDDWNQMLQELSGTPAELIARAVRDHWADCLTTLPRLIERNHAPSIHFYAGSLAGIRKELFPGLLGAYRDWLGTADTDALQRLVTQGQDHWAELAKRALNIWQSDPQGCAKAIKELGDRAGRL